MSSTRLSPILVLCVLLLQTEARADVPPPDSCSMAGQSCSTAPPDYHTSGTCTASKCQKTLPVGDGAVRTHEYDCTLCVAGTGKGGATSAGGATGAGGAAPGGASGAKDDTGSKEDSGCAVGASHAGSALSGLMLLAGALALLGGRRSRRS